MAATAVAHPERFLADRRPARLPAGERPILLVVLDTEEEFDWSAPFDRGATAVEAMRDVGRIQEVCDEFGVRPTYVIDFPVAAQETGWRPLRELQDSGRAVIGAHLHPWVSPPHEERVDAPNSYPGNLPAELEERKLARLTETIAANLGTRPTIYKAGRYGLGPGTAAGLARLGYEIDLSCCAAFDHTADGGPDWSGFSAAPFWFGPGGRLLELPTTGAFVGWLSGIGRGLHRAATRPPLAWGRLPGVLSRAGALERLLLSPEGYRPEHHRRVTRALLARGERVFTFSLHSPSLRPGCTSYVRSEADLKEFLAACRQYFDFFLGELGGVARTPGEVRTLLLDASPPPSDPERDA